MSPESVTLPDPPSSTQSAAAPSQEPAEAMVKTTGEEVEGFHTVRAIVRGLVGAKRVVMRDAQTYCAVLLDDNNRKPICRLRFNNADKLKLGIFNDKKEEEIVSLESVDDIHNYAEQLKATVSSYTAGDA